MKKTYFRVSMYEGADESFCRPIVMAAVGANGDNPVKIERLKELGEAQKMLYPVLYPDVSCELIGDNCLHIDRKVKGEYKTVLVIEQVELIEMTKSELMENEEAIL